MTIKRINFNDGFTSETTPTLSLPAGRSIYTGSSAPLDADYSNGDIYLRSNGDIYLKTAGVWSIDNSIVLDADSVVNSPSGNLSSTTVQAALNELQSDIDTKANSSSLNAHTTNVSNPHSVTKAQVGLGNVDNTSDVNKPVSTAQAAAINSAIANLVDSSPTTLDTLNELAAALGDDPNFATTTATALGNRLRVDTAIQGLSGTEKTNAKTNIDLNNVDNTSDANKPVSTAQATALNLKVNTTGGSVITPARLDMKQDTLSNLTTYALTATNGQLVFATDTKESFTIKDGALSDLGGAGSGSLDTILQLTATEQFTDWSTGNNATVLGGGVLAGSFVKETSTPLHGAESYKYTQAAGSLNDYFLSKAFPVDIRFRGQQVYFSAPIQYDGNTGDIQIVIYDVTNATVLTTLSNSIIGTNGSTQTVIASALLPLTCENIRVGFQVKVLNSGKVFSFDDIQVGQSLYQAAQLNNVTDWQDAGLVAADFTGFGTPTAIQIQSRREGSDLVYRGKFTPGTPTAVEARINLKIAGVSLTSANSISIPSLQLAGLNIRGTATTNNGQPVLIEPSVGYITFGLGFAAGNVFAKANANSLVNSGELMSFNARIPIQGWTAGNTAIVTPTQQVSSDTLPFTFKATAIVDADPVGTFNTYTYAASTNTATISATAPTQTTSDMNANGFRIFGRAYNAASTAASPARMEIKIGKGLKSTQLAAYGAALKTSAATYDYFISGNSEVGTRYQYDEMTGVLLIDCGFNTNSTTTDRRVGTQISNATSPTNGYFVFNASIAPVIAALPTLQPRIATLSDVKPSGTAGGSSVAGTQTRTLNTLVDPTGIVTSLASNQFVLPAGTYYFEGGCPAYAIAQSQVILRNVTDSTNALIGTTEYGMTGANASQVRTQLYGEVTITSLKTFQLNHYTAAVQGTNGLGVASTTGVSEIYSIIKITKVR